MGGGVYCTGSRPTLADCTLNGNYADAYGGGIYIDNFSSPTLTDCAIDDNYGGGVVCDNDSDPTLTRCTIAQNPVGGIRCYYSSPVFVDCAIIANTAHYSGGGLYCRYSNPALANCIITSNSTSGSGGAAHCRDDSTLTLTNCLIVANAAEYAGPGVCCYNDCIASLTGCTFSANVGIGRALITFSGPSVVDVTNCIFWDGGDEISNHNGSIVNVAYSNVQDGWPGEGNIDADPWFVDPVKGDYRLSAGSPCIDAGDNSAVPADAFDLDGDGDTDEPIPFDLDGNRRFVDDPETEDTGNGTPPIVDMGAYEYQPPCPGDLDGDRDVDQSDLGILLSDWGCTSDCAGDVDGDDDTDQGDLGILLGNWGADCP